MNAHGEAKPADVARAIAAAVAWRPTQPDNRRDTGIALVFRGKVYGWKNELRDPQHEKPGAFAVDVGGQAWVAVGGDDYNGATEWQPVDHQSADARQ